MINELAMSGERWDEGEIEFVRESLAKRRNLIDISIDLRRSEEAVRRIITIHRLGMRHHRVSLSTAAARTRRASAMELHAGGATIAAIAEVLGVTTDTVRSYRGSRYVKSPAYPDDIKDLVRRIYTTAPSMQAIQDATGLNKSQLVGLAYRMGIRRKPDKCRSRGAGA